MRYFILLIGAIVFLFSCSKETETIESAPISQYFPLQQGKYIVYQLDSTVFLPFGTSSEVRSYQVKYYTDTVVTDNLGRKGWRIFRYIRKDSTETWTPDASFMAINDSRQLEFVENNMRFIKLSLPIKEGFSWKGNGYIDTYSINSTVKYLDGWNYTYDSLNVPLSIGRLSFDSTLKVVQQDEVLGDPQDPTSYSEINFSVEKYAAGVGMIYKKFYHSEYQPSGGFYADGSYGVEYTIIDHN